MKSVSVAFGVGFVIHTADGLTMLRPDTTYWYVFLPTVIEIRSPLRNLSILLNGRLADVR